MSNSDFIPFALPDIGDEEIAEVVDTLRSGWLTTGPKTRKFEENFAQYLKVDTHALAVNSATSGLHLALECLGVGPGDEVITSPYTFTASAEVVRYLGAEPVFVDIDPSTFNIDPSKIEAKISARTKAIVPVHIGGLACDMDPIFEIAKRRGLRVVDDAAHALPTTYKGRLIGTLASDIVVFSFYATKTITTGEGGMIVTRDPALAERCRVMRLHGINRDVFERYRSTKPSWYYEVVAPGFKYNMTDVAAALGIQQLKKADAFCKRRTEIAKYYDENFAGLPITLPPRPVGEDSHAWHLYLIRLQDGAGIARDVFIEEMMKRGVGCSVHFIPLHIQPYWRDRYKYTERSFPQAFENFSRVVSLPIYTKMSDSQVERVARTVREILA